MFISKEVKELAKDLVDNYQDWFWDEYCIYKVENMTVENDIWTANGVWFTNCCKVGGKFTTRFNLIEKIYLYFSIKKCMKINGDNHNLDREVRFSLHLLPQIEGLYDCEFFKNIYDDLVNLFSRLRKPATKNS